MQNPASAPTSWGPFAFARRAVAHRTLIKRLTVQQVRSRYVGSSLGLIWALVHPIFLLAVFTFVFSVVFQARWGTEVDARGEFALYLFAGLLVYNIFQHCITNAPMILVGRPSYVTKMVFPLDILPWIVLAEALFNAALGFLVFFLLYPVVLGLPPLTVLLLPVILIPLLFFLLGLMWILAATGIYIRDLAQVVGVVALVALFLSPIFYPLDRIPEPYRILIQLNPLTGVIGQVRGAVFEGRVPGAVEYFVSFAVAWVFAWLGYACFNTLRRGFGDVV